MPKARSVLGNASNTTSAIQPTKDVTRLVETVYTMIRLTIESVFLNPDRRHQRRITSELANEISVRKTRENMISSIITTL